ncbi:restriction endonuclease subunit S [Flavobacterium wongokense]|uniref:restriction endonuclease subunit S n=1 Tax=Flavobacterium wongokense TaxID=2910674 RepID=UPI001F33708C|nr:restriction endonuclease subunit S [Flavobacterium sp. WG47]MCF6130893.1 restriction endonuclease subunit S [Flavobacterium sp. WG47]
MNNTDNKLIPELRFPEFVKEGEWQESTIKLLGEIITGGTPSKEENEYWGGDFVWITAQDFKKKYISTSVLRLTQKGKGKSRVVPKNSVLVTCIASIGLNGINKVECATNQQINSIVCNSENYFEFVYYSISKNIERLKNLAGQTAVPIISKGVFEKFTILKPKKPTEQKKIASFLSSIDELIVANTDKLDTLKDHKKGLMQNLFPQEGQSVPKLRFKEFEKNGVWKKNSFDKLFEIGNGRDYKHLNKGEIPVYGTGGYMLSVDDYLYDGESACIGRKGTIDKPMFLEGKFWTVDTLFYTHSFKVCLPKFIFYIFQNIDWKKHNEAGGVPSLSKANIYEIEVFVPKPKEQQKIVDTLSSLDNLIKEQTEEIEQLKQYKKGLMQGLFPKIIN